MRGVSEAYFDPDFDALIDRINPPGEVVVDNETCEDCTLVKVDSANRDGILLEMVQVLTDLDLLISKSYISSDGGWLMDVFHVTDQLGNKITDRGMIHSIQQSFTPARKSASPRHHHHHHHQQSEYNSDSACCTCADATTTTTTTTTIEVAAADRPGLLSEIAAVLAALGCRVSSCRAWTHNSRAAAVLDVHDRAAAVDPAASPTSSSR
uniref:ACT domain-containing protein ACR n=1 Tax=Ananas comosus var. bracteatus TaxID=296719 RepID=A0A6V7QXP8_ANACO